MKIAVMGSGGVGGFYGGRLAHAGMRRRVRCARRASRRDEEHGLKIENESQGDIHLPKVKVTDDPATIGRADLVIIAVKLWDTETAARAVKPIVGPDTAVLSLQNGVIKDDILRREFGDQAVMGGVAYVATHVARPGVIHQTGTLQRLIFGEYDGRRSARADALLAELLRAGIARRSCRPTYAGRCGKNTPFSSGCRARLRPCAAHRRPSAQIRRRARSCLI